MSLYKIERWDVVMFKNSSSQVPLIYIKPDLTFLEFAQANNFAVMCEISDSGTEYDGKLIPGVVDKSCNIPNCRPNFFDKTGYYVITLNANWYGYPAPNKLGNVKFSGFKQVNNTVSEKYGPQQDVTTSLPEKKSLSNIYIKIAAGLLLLLLVIFIITNIYKK